MPEYLSNSQYSRAPRVLPANHDSGFALEPLPLPSVTNLLCHQYAMFLVFLFQVCHSKSGDINPVKIRALVDAYVAKFNRNMSPPKEEDEDHLKKKNP